MKIKCWNKDSGTHIIDIPRQWDRVKKSDCFKDYEEYENIVWTDIFKCLKEDLYTKIETL